MPCNCRINSDPETGEPEVILDHAKYFPAEGRATVCIDKCIAPQIEALWRAGVATEACCCGHNRQIPVSNGNAMVMLRNARDCLKAREVLSSDNRTWWITVWAGQGISDSP